MVGLVAPSADAFKKHIRPAEVGDGSNAFVMQNGPIGVASPTSSGVKINSSMEAAGASFFAGVGGSVGAAVGGGAGVSVGWGVVVGVGVFVGTGVSVGAGVAVGEGSCVAVGSGVADGCGVAVGGAVAVSSPVGGKAVTCAAIREEGMPPHAASSAVIMNRP
jgi:hypothetical protein